MNRGRVNFTVGSWGEYMHGRIMSKSYKGDMIHKGDN